MYFIHGGEGRMMQNKARQDRTRQGGKLCRKEGGLGSVIGRVT